MLLFVPLTIGCETLSTLRYAQPLQPLAGAEVERSGISASENTVSNATQRLSDLACPAGRRNLSRSLLWASSPVCAIYFIPVLHWCPAVRNRTRRFQRPKVKLSGYFLAYDRIQTLIPRFRALYCSFYLVTLSGQFAYPVNSASIFREVAQAMITLRKVSGFVSRLHSSGISL